MKSEKRTVVVIAVSGLMAALVCITTLLIQIPVPTTGGYVNVGDVMVMTCSLVFGSKVGGFAGGVGSAFADIMSGYGSFAPITFIVKGIEGIIVGKVSNGKNWTRDVLAVFLGGIGMVVGYFLGEAFVMGLGVSFALEEVLGNVVQVAVGALVSIPLSFTIRKYIFVQRL